MRLSSLSLSLTALYGAGFSWRSLFADGTPGFRINVEEALRINESVGYDPSKCVAFQDSAGTLPVTAMEQPLGYIKDLSGNDNHFTQPSNTASRPVVSRRVNLLTATEDFSVSPWASVGSVVVTANAAQAPNGTMTASKIEMSGASSRVQSGIQSTSARFRVWVKSAGEGKDEFRLLGNSNQTSQVFTATDEWQVFEFQPQAAGSGANFGITRPLSGADVSVYVWGADLRFSFDANLPPYQRVTSATDYDEVGFPAYAKFDGLDDWLETGGTVDMTSTDEVTVIAGVTKLSDAAAGIVIESSVDATSNAGAIALYAPDAAAATYEYTSRGTASADATASGQEAPRKSLLSGISKISTDTAILRVNGVQAASSSADQGTGNYGNFKFYMGRRGGTTLPFNGRIYGVTVIGKLLTDSQLAAAEHAERQLGRLY